MQLQLELKSNSKVDVGFPDQEGVEHDTGKVENFTLHSEWYL
jgi:hypothetical protein